MTLTRRRSMTNEHYTSADFSRAQDTGEIASIYSANHEVMHRLPEDAVSAKRESAGRKDRISKGVWLSCGIFWTLASIASGVLIFIFFPKIPDLSIINASLGNFEIEKEGNDYNRAKIDMKIKMNVSLYNQNPYRLKMEKVRITARLVVNETRYNLHHGEMRSLIPEDMVKSVDNVPDSYVPNMAPEIGYADWSWQDLAGQARTNVSFTFNFVYKADPALGLLKDPGFFELMDGCGIVGGEGQRTMNIVFDAVSTMSGTLVPLKVFGYYPLKSSIGQIRCPIGVDKIQKVQNHYRSGNKTGDIVSELKKILQEP